MGVISQPIGDICYFLYINTDRKFRRRHMNDCLRWYYDVLSCYLTTIEFRDRILMRMAAEPQIHLPLYRIYQ